MRIVIAGGHGKIALLLAGLLARRGDEVRSLIRNPEHAAEVAETGAEPVLLDLETATPEQVSAALAGADVAVFAAGAGPGSGVARKYTVDRDGSIHLARAAESAGVPRFVQISTMGAGKPPAPDRDEVWSAYIDAKTQAEDDLRARPLSWTILRPGRLTDDHPTNRISLTNPPGPAGAIPRSDVATTLAAILHADNTIGKTLELITGDTPITTAIEAIK
ncbi:SDR family oxidoreductase [Nocardia pseudobrasiliensis]|uniref:Putative NAD(P)-binding protein n=1 Tax=Nocardia pseudobrasiliensis TaxID=45979 RepID=A0A370IAM2_9NOCA|nr:SDR family oxidoreductase [Nocardia pseudobrasiliensis]RDI67779.1 putative NAD(P)-binding protein [Nocardia pseudobrasiliensis]